MVAAFSPSHPMGELTTYPKNEKTVFNKDSLLVDTFGGKIHIEWDPQAAVTPLGQLPFFIEFLKLGGLFDAFVEDCPLNTTSPNA